ncbi:zinc metalloprotease, partial [Psychrobacter sp. 1Y4]
MVSIPIHISASQTLHAVAKRVPWAIAHHPQVLEQHQRKQSAPLDPITAKNPFYLWGNKQPFTLSHDEKVAHY